jgi:hypothetical protein
MTKYKLNLARDVDKDSETEYMLFLPKGFRFYDDIVHCRGFDSIAEIKRAVKNNEVVPCNCYECTNPAVKWW